jgi:hypothetical protein
MRACKYEKYLMMQADDKIQRKQGGVGRKKEEVAASALRKDEEGTTEEPLRTTNPFLPAVTATVNRRTVITNVTITRCSNTTFAAV